jgi:predicted phage terminase large subunit-like protein
MMAAIQTSIQMQIPRAKFRPQSIPQWKFLASRADATIYGGAVGGGKTYALLLAPLRHVRRPGFTGVIFRQTVPQIRQSGGLWDVGSRIYEDNRFRGKANETRLEFSFPSGAKIGFGHVGADRDLSDWAGSQIASIGIDQIEAFSENQFRFLTSRNRSTCGIIPRIRATCNPDPDCWLREFMGWWINRETGYAIPERSGVVRYYVLENNTPDWADSREELLERHGVDAGVLSFTFILSRLQDNPELMRMNPGYLTYLRGLPIVLRERLLMGNWNVRATAGDYFKREKFAILPTCPPLVKTWRYWDRAGTAPKDGKPARGSWTAGCLMGVTAGGRYVIANVTRFQCEPPEVVTRIQNVASQDGRHINIGIEGDPGQAGKSEAQSQIRGLDGYHAEINYVRESKGARALPLSSQVFVDNVALVAGDWIAPFLAEAENFDGTGKGITDQIDAASGAFHMLVSEKRHGTWGR